MTWHPIRLTDLQAILSRDLVECTVEQREFFDRARVAPVKWRLAPLGDQGGGFWAVAVNSDRVLWYNDIEDGFNVSRFDVRGEIPRDEDWCNQDSLRWALPRLQDDPGARPSVRRTRLPMRRMPSNRVYGRVSLPPSHTTRHAGPHRAVPVVRAPYGFC